MATCNPAQLLSDGRCFCSVTVRPLEIARLQLLCSILDRINPTPPSSPFAYTPDTSIITWNDVNGNGQEGDLAFFNATANKPTVTRVDFTTAGPQDISSVTNIQDLPALQTFDMPTNASCTVLDFHGLTALTTVDLGNPNSLVTLNFSGCSALTGVDCFNGPVASLNLTGCSSVTTVDCSSTALSGGSALTVTGCVSMTSLTCNNNDLTAIAGLSTCTALTTFIAHDNSFGTLNLNFMPAHVDTIEVHNNPNLTTLTADNLVDTQHQLLVRNTAIAHLSFPALTDVVLTQTGGDFDCQSNAALLTFSAPNLVTVGGTLTFSNCPLLGDISLPALTTIIDSFGAANCTSITSISMPLLTATGADFSTAGNTSMTTLTLTAFSQTSGGFDINGCSALTALSLPTAGFACVGDFDTHGCTSMVTASFGAGATFGGMFSMFGNTSLTSVSFPGATLGAAGPLNVVFGNCSALTTVNFGTATFTDNGYLIDFTGCAVVAGDATHGIEGLLRRLIVSGVTTISVDGQGGTSAGFAALSAQGQTDFNDLNTAGNSIILNP